MKIKKTNVWRGNSAHQNFGFSRHCKFCQKKKKISAHGFLIFLVSLFLSFSFYTIILYLSMDALNSLNPVKTRNRANSAMSTTLPTPLSPEHTNHRHSQPDPNWRRSQPELSSSAPSASYLNTHPNTGSGDSRSTSNINSPNPDGLTSSLTVEFEGGAHVIVRPNRIIRGKLGQKWICAWTQSVFVFQLNLFSFFFFLL
jgi:hypothetical protein